jgi:hypothetical protein
MKITYIQIEIFAAVKVYIVVFWIMIYISSEGGSEVVTTTLEECAASYLGYIFLTLEATLSSEPVVATYMAIHCSNPNKNLNTVF